MRDRQRPAAAERVLADHRDRALAGGEEGGGDAGSAEDGDGAVQRVALPEAAEVERERVRGGDATGGAGDHEGGPAREAGDVLGAAHACAPAKAEAQWGRRWW